MSLFLVTVGEDEQKIIVEADKYNDLYGIVPNMRHGILHANSRWSLLAGVLGSIHIATGDNRSSLRQHCLDRSDKLCGLANAKDPVDDMNEYEFLSYLYRMRVMLSEAIRVFESTGINEDHKCVYAHLDGTARECRDAATVQIVNEDIKHWLCEPHANKYVTKPQTSFVIVKPTGILCS